MRANYSWMWVISGHYHYLSNLLIRQSQIHISLTLAHSTLNSHSRCKHILAHYWPNAPPEVGEYAAMENDWRAEWGSFDRVYNMPCRTSSSRCINEHIHTDSPSQVGRLAEKLWQWYLLIFSDLSWSRIGLIMLQYRTCLNNSEENTYTHTHIGREL